MTDSNVIQLKSPILDTLGEVLREGAQQLLAKAIETEVADLLKCYNGLQVEGKQAVVRIRP